MIPFLSHETVISSRPICIIMIIFWLRKHPPPRCHGFLLQRFSLVRILSNLIPRKTLEIFVGSFHQRRFFLAGFQVQRFLQVRVSLYGCPVEISTRVSHTEAQWGRPVGLHRCTKNLSKDPSKDPPKDPSTDPSTDPLKDPSKDPSTNPLKDPRLTNAIAPCRSPTTLVVKPTVPKPESQSAIVYTSHISDLSPPVPPESRLCVLPFRRDFLDQ